MKKRETFFLSFFFRSFTEDSFFSLYMEVTTIQIFAICMRHRDTVDVGRRELSRVSGLTARPYEWFNLRSLIQFLVEETRVLVTVVETTEKRTGKCRKTIRLNSIQTSRSNLFHSIFTYICFV